MPGPFLASVSRDKNVLLYNAGTGQLIHRFEGHDNWVRDVVFHPGGRYLLTASDDKVRRRDGPRREIGVESHIACLLSPPPRASSSQPVSRQTIRIWDIENKRGYKTLNAHGHFVAALGACYSREKGGGGVLHLVAISWSVRCFLRPFLPQYNNHRHRQVCGARCQWQRGQISQGLAVQLDMSLPSTIRFPHTP